MGQMIWLLCPVCGNKTRLKVRPDTELVNFPLYCPKCKRETLIGICNALGIRADSILSPTLRQIPRFDGLP